MDGSERINHFGPTSWYLYRKNESFCNIVTASFTETFSCDHRIVMWNNISLDNSYFQPSSTFFSNKFVGNVTIFSEHHWPVVWWCREWFHWKFQFNTVQRIFSVDRMNSWKNKGNGKYRHWVKRIFHFTLFELRWFEIISQLLPPISTESDHNDVYVY